MPLVFAAITPHPPLLVPGIGKEKIEVIHATKEAMARLEEALYLSKPHIVIVISPHGNIFPDAFSVNAHTEFSSSFQEFGDFGTRSLWKGAPLLAAKIAHAGNKKNIPIRLGSQAEIDHGASVPLVCIASHLPDVAILPIGYSGLSPDGHKAFGALLKECIMESEKRIAVIASADMTHDVHGQKGGEAIFDSQIISALKQGNTDEIFHMDAAVLSHARECGYRSILILLGILSHVDAPFQLLSYEAPVGVGYMVGNFTL